nr:MAG TPA: hypothetical protein [Caudoviricetes sp.]
MSALRSLLLTRPLYQISSGLSTMFIHKEERVLLCNSHNVFLFIV